MKKLIILIAITLSLGCQAKGVDNDTNNSDSINVLGENSGKIVSQEMLRTYKTISLDYVASELTGEVSPIISGDTYLIHRLFVIVDGVNYYPEEESMEEKAKDDLPIRALANPRENPEEIVCRHGKTKTFRILLPDHPKQENGKYKYRIEYYADTSNGGICNYTFTPRQTLGDYLGITSTESSH